ncbi:DUF2306 domain-containing protein [Robiginitalea sp. M366]|uniref:DUF2306 domain-containing protein n=1 Tax=Robiginitalea aestuariiviva TaxID=3036903 RepID=UPI00240D7A2D|nr:DUF2306 domain-containing protein [Robiginitalea aestuariiviva]MDG1572151.1 DUF2306 domain-containing protein [Robiginitalea aestuariiviva]
MTLISHTNKVAWFAFGLLAVLIGLYPLVYLTMESDMGLLGSKSETLLADPVWNAAFYGHISFGGLSLLTGWTQFSRRLRRQYLGVHRRLGAAYVISALLSGACGVYLSFFATGGWVAGLGFFLLGISWIFFTVMAYRSVRIRDFQAHGLWMVYSFAACFAAVTLRLWLPLLSLALGDFIPAYRLVAWLCWVPNLIFAYFWVKRKGLTLG